MNAEMVKGKWSQIKGNVKVQWGKLTDNDLDVINGERDKLVGKIQERYGRTKEAAQAEVDRYFDRM